MPLVKAFPRSSQSACKILVRNQNISRSLTSCTSKNVILNGFKSSCGSLLSSINAQNCLDKCQKRGVRVFQPYDIQDPPPTVVEVQQRVLKAIKTFDRLPKDKEITLSTNFSTDLGLDSLDHVELFVAVEQEFDFEIADEAGDSLMTPNDLVKYVCENTLITIEEPASTTPSS